MGQTIGRYTVSEQVARGRRSLIYHALSPDDEQRVVLKAPLADPAAPSDIERLEREHQLIERIRHDAVVSTLGFEKIGSSAILVLEYVPGVALRDRLRDGPYGTREFLSIAIQLAAGLEAIHEAGVIHEDLTARNVIVDPPTNTAKIIDFDISSSAQRKAVTASPTSLKGTLAYMSPEQTGRIGHSVDHRTDLYSIGVLFFEMLTGRLPFPTHDPMDLVHHHIAVEPPSPSAINDSIPGVLSDIVLRLMAKSAQERYQSALGLKSDLETCLRELRADGSIPAFQVGRCDVSPNFELPRKLYGRDEEHQAILRAFDGDGHGTRVVLVSGYSGIGKSRLIGELHKPIVARHGYFVSGKFDQFKRNVPFASLFEAFRELVGQLLTESEEAIAEWRKRLSDALGPNGQLIVDVIPEVRHIIGPQELVVELPPMETRNRFERVFREFVGVVCNPAHPLCLFLDDLQWVDSATLDWIRSVATDPSLESLVLVGAYRDNEVDGAHPLAIAIDDIVNEGGKVVRINLQPLPPSAVNELVADTLQVDVASCRELATLIRDKTGGNPFFVIQLLASLHERDAIRLDRAAGRWTYDITEVRAAEITDNVVDLIVGRIERLTEGAQHTLSVAACVGSRFELELVAAVRGVDHASVRESIGEAVRQGLVDETGRHHELRFLHDRVQQAAHTLIDPAEEKRIRLDIARRLIEQSDNIAEDDDLFTALQHARHAQELVTSDRERLRLADLNWLGSVRALRATAYSQALMLVETAEELLRASSENAPPHLPFELAIQHAECEHLSGNGDEATRYFDRSLELANDDAQKARVYEKRVHFLTNAARFREAYDVGREGAALFGVALPSRFFPPSLLVDFARIKLSTRGRVSELVTLPLMTDERMATGAKLATSMLKAAYQVQPELCVAMSAKLVRLCLAHGNFPDAPVAYLPIGPIFQAGVLGHHAAGYDWGQLCLKLVDELDNVKQAAEIKFVYGYFAHSWTKSLSSTERLYREAYRTGLETGDHFHASCACTGIVQGMLMRGAPLAEVERECARFLEFLERVRSTENIGTLESARQAIRCLRGETRSVDSFDDDDFDEHAFVASLKDYGSEHFAAFYFVNKLQTLYHWRQRTAALELTNAAQRFIKACPGLQQIVDQLFYEALLYADAYSAGDEGPRSTWLRELRRAANRFEKWARRCPENFEAKYLLVRAELARIDGPSERAAASYDAAVRAAAKHGFRQVEALGLELAGRFYAERGQDRSAAFHLAEAIHAYSRWGATALGDTIAEQYPALVSNVHRERGRTRSTTATRLTGGVTQNLDVEMVFKASQAISGEVVLRKLLEKLVEILLQSGGATRVVLLLREGGSFRVQAEGDATGKREVLTHTPYEDHLGIAQSVVNYVIRTKESVLINDPQDVGRFATDEYLAERAPRAVFCAPLVRLGELAGIVYMENGLVSGAFTERRTELLQLLSGQFAISIENAFAYEHLELKVRERTQQLEARNQFIRQTFGRYLTDDVVAQLLEAPSGLQMGGEMREATILMADLRGFTTVAERLGPAEVVALLNNYLGVMTEVILDYSGTIDEFIGDAILVIFGAPVVRNDDPMRAVACAVAMQRAMTEVNEMNRKDGLPTVEMGIGINTGEVVVGNIGSRKRAKYGVVGRNVNLASRIESYTTGGQILISQKTLDRAAGTIEYAHKQRVAPKGVEGETDVYEVSAVRGAYDIEVPTRQTELVPLEREIPIRCVVLVEKKPSGTPFDAWFIRLSQQEAHIRSTRPIAPLTDVEVSVLGSDGREVAKQVYAKVVERDLGETAGFAVAFTSIPDEARAALHLD